MDTRLLFPIAVGLIAGLVCAPVAAPAESAAPHRVLGSQTCSSTACHGSAPDASRAPIPREAFIRWVQSDPHARAHETLVSERYQQILTRVSNRDDGGIDPQVQTRCAQCHDPQGAGNSTVAHSSFTKGIGCESCHGPAEKWLTRHYERDISRDELASLGMTDTKSLASRAEACARCHVGSVTQDMNHDMIAAGHPPLRFELAAYHDLIAHKHWNDTRPRLDFRDYQVKLWAAGQKASAAASLELLQARCQKGGESWPEFAEYDCFRCHQRLQPKTASGPRGKGLLASRWHFVFADAAVTQNHRDLLTANFAGNPQQILSSLTNRSTESAIAVDLSAQQLVEKVHQSLAANLLANSDWETRCQQFLALAAAERSYRDELARQQFLSRLRSSELQLRLNEEKVLLADLAQVRTWLQFESAKLPGTAGPAKTVLIDEPLEFRQRRDEIGPQLQRIAEQLKQRMEQLP